MKASEIELTQLPMAVRGGRWHGGPDVFGPLPTP
jgi:hypothetical protein